MSDVRDLDPAVLRRAQAGDPGAFAVLVRQHDRQLRALAYGLLGDRHRMDDVLQEVYVKAFRALPRFRAEASVGTWLNRITYNACIDELRRGGRRPPPIDPLVHAESTAAAGGDPQSRIADRLSIDAALATLTPDQRAVVLLVDGEGLGYDACAEILGVAPGTVASRLNRARAALRRALGGEESR